MITLCLLLTACGRTGEDEAASLREHYHDMAGCSMEALVTCDQEGLEWEARLKCEYVPGGEITVEVLEPETIAGVRAVLNDTDWSLEFEDASLNSWLSQRGGGESCDLPAKAYERFTGRLAAGGKRETWNECLYAALCGSEWYSERKDHLHHLAAAGRREAAAG